MNPTPVNPKICIGRLQFEPPQGWHLHGRSQNAFRVAMMDKIDSPEAFEQVNSRPAVEAFLRSQLSEDKEVVKIKSEKARTILHAKSKTMEPSKYIFAYYGLWPQGLFLQALYGPGFEDKMEDALDKIYKLYHPGQFREFCLENGSIQGERSQYEEIGATFVDSKEHPKFYLSVRSNPTGRDAEEPFPTLWMRFVLWWKLDISTLVFRDRNRTVAGFKGREMISSMTETKKVDSTIINFRYYYSDSPQSKNAQTLEINLETKPEHRKLLEPLWDRFLDQIESVK